jgi:uncharacterized membrane protein
MNILVNNIIIPAIKIVILLFIPGYLLLFSFFKKEKLNFSEQILSSFTFSIITNCLIIIFLHHFNLKINLLNLILAIIGLIAIKFLCQRYKFCLFLKNMIRYKYKF